MLPSPPFWPSSPTAVQVLVGANGVPMPLHGPWVKGEENPEYAVFTSGYQQNWSEWPLELRPGQGPGHGPYLQHFSMDRLAQYLPVFATPQKILVNPRAYRQAAWPQRTQYEAQEILWAPYQDPLTNKWLTSDAELALPLLALRNEDMARLGVEAVFHVLSSRHMPEDADERIVWFEKNLKELEWLSRHALVPQGNCSLFCIILNLENRLMEKALVRPYPTLAPWVKPLFVTSEREILDGQLRPISFNGSHVDGILLPLIEWYRS